MIEKERLQELIEQEETVWCVSELWGINKLKLHNKDVRYSDCFHISKTLLLSDSIEFYDEEETYRVPFQLLFETQQEYLKHQEEAEWVAKMHTERTEKFEPPTWEDFERENKPYRFIGKSGLRETIYIFDKNIHNKLLSAGSKLFGKPTKENYEKAVEYARKLFLGVEDDKARD